MLISIALIFTTQSAKWNALKCLKCPSVSNAKVSKFPSALSAQVTKVLERPSSQVP